MDKWGGWIIWACRYWACQTKLNLLQRDSKIMLNINGGIGCKIRDIVREKRKLKVGLRWRPN